MEEEGHNDSDHEENNENEDQEEYCELPPKPKNNK